MKKPDLNSAIALDAALARVKDPAAKLVEQDYAHSAVLRRAKAQYVSELLATRRADIRVLSGGAVDADRLVAIIAKAVAINPKLAECSVVSMVTACLEAAELGVMPSSVQGMAHLVPFWNGKKNICEAKLIPDYRGLVHLARESGSAMTLSAGVIYEGQRYTLREGLTEMLEIEPLPPGSEERDEAIIYAWALARIATPQGQATQWIYMTRAQIDKVRASSRAKDSGPWVQWFPEMAKKTAIKRLAKLLPRKGRFARALELEDAAEAGEPGDDVPGDAELVESILEPSAGDGTRPG